ncbi:MAG TPA: DNA methyltransferase [Rhizomicrobium sp.]|jgi:DNA modification methylase
MIKTRKSAPSDKGPRLSDCPTIEHLPIESISPNPLNPRQHSRDQVRAIAQSIRTFGFNAPLLLDKHNRSICGHGRLEAAKLLKLATVPAVRLEHLTEQQAQAYMLADNKLTDRSSWDDGKLALRLRELQTVALDFDIETTGFELPEIDFRIQSLDTDESINTADEISTPQGPAISRTGDLWHLGPHRLFCGNSLELQTYNALLGAESATAVFTDPPYNVPISGHAVGKGRARHREFVMASGEMSSPEFKQFLVSALANLRARLAPGGVYFMCMDWRHIREIVDAIDQSNLEIINLCVWAKSNGGMGSLYRSAHELVFVFRARGARHRNNVQLGRFGRNRTNLWHYAGMNSFPRQGQERALDLHPTVKPIALVADAILDVTKRNDIVLDPFCGSGTTILAAERTGRRGYGIELDPLYVDLAISRWQRISGKLALHENGGTFAEICKQRNVSAGGTEKNAPMMDR